MSRTQTQMRSVAAPTPGSVRSRRYRERIKSGKVYVRFEMTLEGVDRLITQGWLAPEKRDDWRAVTTAFLNVGISVLWPEKMQA